MKTFLVSAALVLFSVSGFAYQSQFGLGDVGDFRLEAIGRYKFSDFATIDLMPTNAPSSNGLYRVRCQVIFTDSDDDRPLETDLQRRGLQLTGDWLLDQLKVFVAENYVGAEFDDLLGKFYSGVIGIDVNERFPLSVKERMADVGLDLDVVRIQVLADADLLSELRALFAKVVQEQ